jgi:hypothetical protein
MCDDARRPSSSAARSSSSIRTLRETASPRNARDVSAAESSHGSRNSRASSTARRPCSGAVLHQVELLVEEGVDESQPDLGLEEPVVFDVPQGLAEEVVLRTKRLALAAVEAQEAQGARPVGAPRGRHDARDERLGTIGAGVDVVAGGLERPADAVRDGTPRRQRHRLLHELGGGGSSAGPRLRGGGFDPGCGRLVRLARGECEMARSLDRVGDERGGPPVDGAPLTGSCVRVQHGREQRMREPHLLAVQHEHVGVDRLVQRVTRQERAPLAGTRRRREQRSARRRRENGETPPDEPAQGLRHRQRRTRSGVGTRIDESACELEREERIAAGGFVDLQQHRTAEGAGEPVLEEPLDRARAQRADPEPGDDLRSEDPLQLRRLDAVAQLASQQERDRLVVHAPQGEAERRRRGRIQPPARRRRPAAAARVPPRPAGRCARQPRACGPPAPARADLPTRRAPAPARPPPGGRAGLAGLVRARPRPPRATASTSRSPPRPRARALRSPPQRGRRTNGG